MQGSFTTDHGKQIERIEVLLRSFKLPTVCSELIPRLKAAGFLEALDIVEQVLEMERQDRWERKVTRLRHQSKLPPGKTLESLDLKRFPRPLAAKIHDLSQGNFVDMATNVLAFGLPGTGKSHTVSAIGHCLVQTGHSVLWIPTFKLIQNLLKAKTELELPRALRKLDNFSVIILDDIGYVQQSPEEVEVLFTLLAERYERRSMIITSNLVFSQWDQIFKNPMTTAAAIDRLVHHCVILEFDVPSYRASNRNSGVKETHSSSDSENNKPKDETTS